MLRDRGLFGRPTDSLLNAPGWAEFAGAVVTIFSNATGIDLKLVPPPCFSGLFPICTMPGPGELLLKTDMKKTNKPKLCSFLLAGIFTYALGGSHAAAELIVYPNAEKPLFSIEVPKNWTLTPATQEDQFFLVSGPGGVQMWFRAKPISSEAQLEGAIEAARKSGREWLAESYNPIVLEEAVMGDRDGMAFVSVNGNGTSRADGVKVKFAVAFAAMPNGALAQFWAILPNKDPAAERYFKKVLESFQPR